MTSTWWVDVAAKTDVGGRENNEDNYLVGNISARSTGLSPDIQRHEIGAGGSVFVVSDGVGGEQAGEIASSIAVHTVVESMFEWQERGAGFEEALRQAIHEANRKILEHSSGDPRLSRMGATLTAAGVLDGILYLGHVGDSRAYLFRNGSLRQLTRDQTQAQALVDAGVLDPGEARQHDGWHLLAQALGSDKNIDVTTQRYDLEPGDVLLLGTDGLTDALADDQMEEILGKDLPLWERCHLLVEAARASDTSEDNITVLLVRLEDRSASVGAGGRPRNDAAGIPEARRSPVGDPWAARGGGPASRWLVRAPLALAVVLAAAMMAWWAFSDKGKPRVSGTGSEVTRVEKGPGEQQIKLSGSPESRSDMPQPGMGGKSQEHGTEHLEVGGQLKGEEKGQVPALRRADKETVPGAAAEAGEAAQVAPSAGGGSAPQKPGTPAKPAEHGTEPSEIADKLMDQEKGKVPASWWEYEEPGIGTGTGAVGATEAAPSAGGVSVLQKPGTTAKPAEPETGLQESEDRAKDQEKTMIPFSPPGSGQGAPAAGTGGKGATEPSPQAVGETASQKPRILPKNPETVNKLKKEAIDAAAPAQPGVERMGTGERQANSP